MNEAWRVAHITSFEQVPVGVASGLLRVAASSNVASSASEPRPELLADDGYTVSRFEAIPAPPDVGGTLRVGYSVPSYVINPATVFSLQFDDGYVIALPAPTHGPPRMRDPEPAVVVDVAPPELVSVPEPTDAPEPLPVLDFVLDAAEARAELEAVRELAALRAAPAPVQREVDVAATADAEQRIAEADVRADSAALELAAAREDLDDLRTVVAALQEDASGAAQRLELALRERDEARIAREAAEQAVGPLRAARARADSELAGLRDQVHKMGLERDELGRQASAFDEIAVKARERAAELESEHRDSGARLAELEVWSGELERRLAETTTALADATAAAESDEAELRRLRGELAESRARVELGVDGEDAMTSSDDGSPNQEDLRAIGEAAFDDAHRQAERDLANPVS